MATMPIDAKPPGTLMRDFLRVGGPIAMNSRSRRILELNAAVRPASHLTAGTHERPCPPRAHSRSASRFSRARRSARRLRSASHASTIVRRRSWIRDSSLVSLSGATLLHSARPLPTPSASASPATTRKCPNSVPDRAPPPAGASAEGFRVPLLAQDNFEPWHVRPGAALALHRCAPGEAMPPVNARQPSGDRDARAGILRAAAR